MRRRGTGRMEETTTNTVEEQRQNQKNKYLLKLLLIIKHRGFSHLRIDDVVRHMDISKATFYKHFSSKEEVIERVVDIVVDYLDQSVAMIKDESFPYLQ